MSEKQKSRQSNELRVYRADAVETANELCYKWGVIQRIKEADSIAEIARIMNSARAND